MECKAVEHFARHSLSYAGHAEKRHDDARAAERLGQGFFFWHSWRQLARHMFSVACSKVEAMRAPSLCVRLSKLFDRGQRLR